MKKTKLDKLLGAFVLLAGASLGRAETLSLYDDTFTMVSVPGSVGSGILSGRWGTWDAGTSTFTQLVTNTLNAGYVDLSGPEMSITLNQTSNSVYASNTLLAFAIFTDGSADSQTLSYSPSYNYKAVLIDPLWKAVTFANNANFVNYVFSSNTSAVIGSYSYNGGNEVIALVPEPSTGALMMIGAAGLVALRRLRKV
jgi:hypothetical protein